MKMKKSIKFSLRNEKGRNFSSQIWPGRMGTAGVFEIARLEGQRAAPAVAFGILTPVRFRAEWRNIRRVPAGSI